MKVKIYSDTIEENAIVQFNKCLEMKGCVQGALMPDAHAGYTAPIGSVLKFKNRISPQLVGYDIGCGMSAIRLNIKKDELTNEDLIFIKNKILKDIPIGKGKHSKEQNINLDVENTSDLIKNIVKKSGIYQLGTLGGGNHFIEVGYDKDDFINIVIHSGSRGVGGSVADHYMRLSVKENFDTSELIEKYKKEFKDKNGSWEPNNPDAYLKHENIYVKKELDKEISKMDIEGYYSFDINSESGMNYLKDMNFALVFALENRRTMIDVIVNIFRRYYTKKDITTSRFINRNHNHAEIVDEYIIHRKGATHALKGMLGVIPGNMKDGSFIVVGKGNEDSMCSSSHGAGRVLSRQKALNEIDVDDFHKEMEGIITNHNEHTRDEAPKAYKNIFEVMDMQKELVEVIDRVIPIINVKG